MDASRFPEGVIIEGSLLIARPISTLVRDTVTGQLFVSSNAAVATYAQITNTGTSGVAGLITVAISGGDHTTIAAGLAAAVSGDVVQVYPGTYPEGGLTIPAGVRLVGTLAAQAVIISGADTTSTRVIISAAATLRNLTVIGPSAGANPGCVDCSGLGAGDLAVLEGVVVRAGGGTASGPLIYGAGSGTLEAINIEHNGGTTAGAYVEIDSGRFVFNGVAATAGTAGDVLKLSGTSIIEGQALTVTSLYSATDGIDISATADAQIDGILMPDTTPVVTNALHITGDGVSLSCTGAHFHGITWDCLADPALVGTGTELRLQAELRQERLSAPATWFTTASVFFFSVDDGINNDASWRTFGRASFGAPVLPSEATFGEGDSYTDGMIVLSDDGTGTAFVDNTAAARSGTGSTFSLLQSTASGEVAYVGQPDFRFNGVKVDGGGTAYNSTGGAGVWEYSTGPGTWSPFNVMATDAAFPYAAKAQDVFEITTTDDHIRFDMAALTPANWIAAAVDGTTAFWVRFRLTSGPITTVPVLQRIKLSSNRTEINEDGLIEFFGAAEPTRGIASVSLAGISDLAGSSPSNVAIVYSANVTLTPVDNSFNNNVLDGFGVAFTLPPGVDTSRPTSFIVQWLPSTANTGDVEFEVITVRARPGDTVAGALPEVSTTTLVTVGAATQDQLYRTEIAVGLEDFAEDDVVVLALRRDATGVGPPDTFVGNVEITSIELLAVRWRP